jgi:predicted ATPase
MSSYFRLNSLQIEEKYFNTKKIVLTRPSSSDYDNFYTLIVGNNGTGKSRLLGSIARYFSSSALASKGRSLFEDGFSYDNNPNSVIALTSSLSDKFPNDQTFRINTNKYSTESNYYYLGNRNKANAFSSKALLSRALEIMFNNLTNIVILNKYCHLFEYLQYKPIIKLEYKTISIKKLSLSDIISIKDLEKYILEKSKENTYGKSFFATFSNSRKQYIPSLQALLNKILSKESDNYQLLINFSPTNIERMNESHSDYSEATKEFFLFNMLEKLELVKRFSIKAYKEDNSEFDFHEASSGEVNILSTFIALIPLLSNGCLVLIDEPEISLHPSWQYRYIELLLKIFENFSGCHIIIASHSHFLVSDLPIGNSSVITLVNEKGLIKSEMIEGSTYGWSAEDILLNVFDLPTTRNYYLSQLITEALELLAKHDRKNERFNILRERISYLEHLIKVYDPLKSIMKSIINFDLS